MANCNDCSRGCTRVGALDTVCRRNPYYTGPCPSAPCNSGCNGCTQTNCNYNCSCDWTENCRPNRPERPERPNRPNWCDEDFRPWRPPYPGWCEGWPWFPMPNPNPPMPPVPGPGPGPRPVAQGVFTATTPLTLAAGATIPLVAQNTNANDFAVSNGIVTIRRPGLYYASLNATVPEGDTINTELVLTLDGQRIAPSGLDFTTGTTSGQGLFYANTNSQLTLTTTEALDADGTTAQNVVTLNLVRVR